MTALEEIAPLADIPMRCEVELDRKHHDRARDSGSWKRAA